MKKILFGILILLISLTFVQADTCSPDLPSCNGCLRDCNCYNLGTRLTIPDSEKGVISVRESEPLIVNGYTISVFVSNSNSAKFTITSSKGTEKVTLAKGESEKILGGKYLIATDIKYREEDDSSATFYIEGPSYNLGLSWRTEKYLFCEGDKKTFILQKITGEICENDFECQSNKCYNKKCEQKQGIKIIKIYEDQTYLIKNLFFQPNETFYFSGLNKNYSISFGKINTDFIFFINDNSYDIKNKTFVLDSMSHFILNSLSFNDGIVNANITLVESKNSIDDSTQLLENLLGDKEEINVISQQEIPQEENYSAPITGGAIETKEQNFFERLLDFFRQLFSK